jgi:hypothetical protein
MTAYESVHIHEETINGTRKETLVIMLYLGLEEKIRRDNDGSHSDLQLLGAFLGPEQKWIEHVDL